MNKRLDPCDDSKRRDPPKNNKTRPDSVGSTPDKENSGETSHAICKVGLVPLIPIVKTWTATSKAVSKNVI